MRQLLASAALVVGASILGCSGPPSPVSSRAPAEALPDLRTVEIESVVVARETTFDGVVQAVNRSTVSAQTSGRVVDLPYDVGDYVAKDAVIVRITTVEQRARSTAAQAALAEARARLAEAELAHGRIRDVYQRNLIAKAQYDKAAADLDSARARVESARAALTQAQEGLEHTTIRAPYPGIVVSRQVQLGETVAPGQPLMTGVSLDSLRVEVDIPQQHIGALRRHRKARAILPNGRSVPIVELRLPPAADPATHSFRVLAQLPELDAEGGVLPGTLVKVAFVSGETHALLVPPEAVVRRGEITACYVLDPQGRVSFRAVRLGYIGAEGQIPVLAGLAAGEKVIVDPLAAVELYMRQHGRSGA